MYFHRISFNGRCDAEQEFETWSFSKKGNENAQIEDHGNAEAEKAQHHYDYNHVYSRILRNSADRKPTSKSSCSPPAAAHGTVEDIYFCTHNDTVEGIYLSTYDNAAPYGFWSVNECQHIFDSAPPIATGCESV